MKPPVEGAVLELDAAAIEAELRRVAGEILAAHPETREIALIGIPSRGVHVAERLAGYLRELSGHEIASGAIDVSMHRDDLHTRRPRAMELTRLPERLDEKTLILADDVLFSGRTTRAAMDALSSFGRPARIQLATLIDRGHRELPIRPDSRAGDFDRLQPARLCALRGGGWRAGQRLAGEAMKEAPAPAAPAVWSRKDLTGLEDLSPAEITTILDTAAAFKRVGTREIKKVPALRGKTLVNFFVEPSTRTRI